MTEPQADELLRKDLAPRVSDVRNLTAGLNLTQCQFDALVSFQYNTNRLAKSQLLLDLIKGERGDNIRNDFLKYNLCNDKVSDGLTNRRKAEWKIFTYGDYNADYLGE